MLARHRSGIPASRDAAGSRINRLHIGGVCREGETGKAGLRTGQRAVFTVPRVMRCLARVLEIASGKTYAQLLQEYVFTPAGMTDSVDFEGDAIIERRAQDYYLSPNGLVNVPLKNYSFLVGAGSVYGTARDVYQIRGSRARWKVRRRCEDSVAGGRG